MTKLNVGCGSKILSGYINIDLFVKHPNVVNMDVSKLKFDDNSIEEILAEDIIEHFPRLQWKEVIDEWVRVIKPDGILSLQFPEMKQLSQALIDSKNIEDWEKYNRRIFGGQGDGINNGQGMFHYTGFSYEYMREWLEKRHSLVYVEHHYHNYNCFLVMKKKAK